MEYELFTPGNETCCDSKDASEHTGRSLRVKKPSTLKVLLVVLSLLLLCSLVALCVLGFLYFRKGVYCEALREQNIRAIERLEVQEHNSSELKAHLDQVQMNYVNALKRLESFKEECQRCSLCGEGWRSFGTKRYYFSTDTLNWMEGRDRCAEKGGHLVIITSPAEQNFMSSCIRETHWIGLNDLETEGKWMWVNNQTLNETGVTFWYERMKESHEPDNWREQDPSGENCAALGNEVGETDAWFDASCLKRKKYICEK